MCGDKMNDIHIPWGEERVETTHRKQEIDNYFRNIEKLNELDSPSKRLIFWFSQCLTKFKQCPPIWPKVEK